jgi:septum formation protein
MTAMEPRALILASGSPRRRVLLRRDGFNFVVVRPDVDERPLEGEAPSAMVERLAGTKAGTVAAEAVADSVVLAADTAVVLDGAALGKPRDADDAVRMLMDLGDGEHHVVTGYSLSNRVDGIIARGVAKTAVVFRPVARREAEAYVATGEPLDKAGAYGIQGLGRQFVAEVRGSFTNVMGLPMEVIGPLLVDHGVPRSPGRQGR